MFGILNSTRHADKEEVLFDSRTAETIRKQLPCNQLTKH